MIDGTLSARLCNLNQFFFFFSKIRNIDGVMTFWKVRLTAVNISVDCLEVSKRHFCSMHLVVFSKQEKKRLVSIADAERARSMDSTCHGLSSDLTTFLREFRVFFPPIGNRNYG